MSVKIIGQVWDLALPYNELLVLLALADHADHEGKHVYPSLELIAWKVGYTERQVRRIVRKLEEDRILHCERAGGGRHKPTEYSIIIENGVKKTPFRINPDSFTGYAEKPGQFDRVNEINPDNLTGIATEKEDNFTPKKEETRTFATQNPDIAMSAQPKATVKKDKSKNKTPSIISPQGEMDDSEGGVQLKSSKRKAETSKAQRRCPPDYLPDASVIAWAAAKHPGIDLQGELEAMKDWEFKIAHSDWNATFRNWIRTAVERHGKNGDARLSKRENFSMNAAQRFLDREEEYDTEHQESSIYRTPGRNERLLLR